MRSFLRIGVLTLPLLVAAACGGRSSTTYGDANSIVLITTDSVWEASGPAVEQILEPRIMTVRDERTFEITPVAPDDPALKTYRRWRQVLVVGEATDPWVAEVLEGAPALPDTLPAIVERDEVWARDQRVTAVVLPQGGGAESFIAILPELHRLLDQRFRAYVRTRMFVSGRNDSLQSALRAQSGFGLLLPSVYTVQQPNENTYIFRNDQMVGGILERVILVTWRQGATPLSAEEIQEWRDVVSAQHHHPVQKRQPGLVETQTIEGYGPGALEVRGAWEGDLDGFPLAGPYITRSVVCPTQDRTYLLDASLYAPGRDKYEYMLQLETILNTFECGA